MSFTRSRRGRVVLDLDEHERATLRGLLAQVVELVESPADAHGPGDDPLAAMVGIGTATSVPLDPALARLFPDAYSDDDGAAGDFRRYTEVTLRRRKAADAAAAMDTLDEAPPVTLDPAARAAWLGAINDLRLVIGVRLDIQEDDDPLAWAESPEAGTYLLYWWLTQLQGDLLDALD